MLALPNRRKSRTTAILLSALVLALVPCAGRSADASAMKTVYARSQRGQALALARYTRAEQRLSQYYAQALATQRLNVFVPAVLRNIQSEKGLLHESSFVAYLQWRRSLAPSRFDFYHPGLGRAIITDHQIRQTVVQPPPIIPTPINPAPGEITPPPSVATPEPSSMLIAGLMVVAGVWVKWRTGETPRG
jgi:hypothetical protein